jgi:hypothetical protein
MKIIAGLLALLALGGCNSTYPHSTPFAGTSPAANPAPRGTPAFCDQYGRQTAANDYGTNRDPEDGFGSNAMAEERARQRGEDATRRCLSGRRG